MKQKLYYLLALTFLLLVGGGTNVVHATVTTVGYTEAINGEKLDGRVLTNGGLSNLTISEPKFGSSINNYKGTSKSVSIDNTSYANTDSWRKSVKDSYENQNVGYQLTVGTGYKMNISKVNARIAVADDTYTWYVSILNSAGTEVWKSGERTTKKESSGKIDNVDVSDKEAIQGLTGTVTVNLWVKQGGSTKYFSINYLQLGVELEEDARTNYTITANVADGQSAYGSIDKAGDNSVPEGENISLTATANAGYGFINWTKGGSEISTNATLPLTNITADATYVANFKKLYKVSYNLESYAGTITGKVLCNYKSANGINEIYADVDDKFTIPAYAHRYLYREGYTFAGWSDGKNTYQSGDVINGLTSDITLTPTWTATIQSLSNSNAETVVTWSFAKSNLVFVDWQSNDKYGYNTETATVNQEDIAVPMKIMNGKVANYTRGDAIAQTNKNTTLTIPAVKGMKVEIADAYTNFSTTTIAGSTDYTGTGTKTIEYTYTGTEETIDIVIGEDNQYLKTVVATYPLVEKRTESNLTITAPANGAWSVDLDDQLAAKTQQIVYSSSSDGAITYTSSNTTIATVSANGLITAKSNGTATITVSQAATDAYQAGEATINVTVTGGVTILGTDEVSLVYTTSGYDSNTKTWTNGTYTLVGSNGISGNDGQCFKLQNYTYTLKVPSNIRVDKIEYTGYDYNGSNSVTEGETSTATITVDGATALTGWKAYYEHYGSAVNTTVAQEISHNTGEDITLAVTGAGQILGTLKLYVSEIKPTTAPTLVSQSNTTKRNGSVVLTFSQPMASATATIDGQSVTAEGGTSTLAFYYWGLDYGKQVTFTLPASAIKDAYDNNYEGEDITVNFTIDAKQALTKKKFDVIVGTEGNEDLQAVLNAYKDYSGSERKYIFIPDGKYKLTGNSSFTTNATLDNEGATSKPSWTWNEETGALTEGTYMASTKYTDNAMTQLRSSNLSIIGQSKDNTIIYNIPYIPGISYTSTLELRSGSDNYLQDFTLKNMYAGGANDKGVAVAFYDRGTRTIAKNISCWSNQDTYVSNGARDYYETSTFAGTVDFICGNGDVWFQQCDLIINNRSGNVITAPRTAATEKWGYVFYENTISRAEGATLVTDKSWNLGRPWNDSPAATFLYTTMNTLPKDAGWTNMSNGKVLRFHEYGSKNASGSTLNLSSRSISACNGDASSDNPVLTAEQAAKYTIHNVLGGTDGWDPTEYTAQVSVTGLALNGNTLTWDDNEDALCWMIFKDGVYYDNVITNSVTADGAGEYTVRAANARGGLGEGMTVTNVPVIDNVMLTWNIAVGTDKSDITSTQTSTTEAINTMSAISASKKDTAGKDNLSVKLNCGTADAAAATVTFAVPAGYAFVPSAATAYVQPISEDAYVSLTLSDANNSLSNEATSFTQGQRTETTLTVTGNKYYTGTVTLGIYCYDGASTGVTTYRLGTPITITGKLVAVEPITTNTFGNVSHVAGKALDFSGVEGMKAYVATAADGAGITLAEVTAVPAGTAFVVQATEKAENTYYVPTTTEEVTLSSQNVFEGNATEPTATLNGYTYYALSKSKGMFAKVASTVQAIPAGKAFVKIQAGGGAKETLAFIINGETTGIAEAEVAEAQQGGVRKQLINGRLVIIKGDKRYNAAGAEF